MVGQVYSIGEFATVANRWPWELAVLQTVAAASTTRFERALVVGSEMELGRVMLVAASAMELEMVMLAAVAFAFAFAAIPVVAARSFAASLGLTGAECFRRYHLYLLTQAPSLSVLHFSLGWVAVFHH